MKLRYDSPAWRGLVLAVLGVAVAVVYAVTLRAPFVFDDLQFILGNPGLQKTLELDKLLADGMQEVRPIYQLSLAANFAIGGVDVVGYHVVNVALHAVCVALVYALARDLRGDVHADATWLPEVTAALFAMHPLATESVAYVSARPGVLATAFGLAGLLAFLRYDRDGGWFRLALAVLALALSSASKESGVSFPAIAVAYVFIVRGDSRLAALRERWPSLLAVLATVAVVPLMYVIGENPHAEGVGSEVLPWGEHYLTQARVIAFFALLSLVPVANNFDYDPPISRTFDGHVAGGTAFIVALLAGAWFARRRAPAVALGIVWFFLAIAPTNPGVPFANFMAERYLYAALIGPSLVLGWAFSSALSRTREAPGQRVLIAVVVVGVVVAFAGRTAARNVTVADPVALWTDTAAKSPGKSRPLVNLGVVLSERGDFENGRPVLEAAVAVDPSDPRAHYNLGVLHQREKRPLEALQSFRTAVDLGNRARHRHAFASLANSMAIDMYRQNLLDRAEILLREALRVGGEVARYHFNLGVVLEASGRVAAARAELERALELDPGYEKAKKRLDAMESGAEAGTEPDTEPGSGPGGGARQ